MELRPLRHDVWIEADEVEKGREALRRAGESEEQVQGFSGAAIHDLLAAWAQFVATDWTRWDISEYLNDIRVRDRLDVIWSALGDQSRSRLTAVLGPLDRSFKARMHAVEAAEAKDPRFWVANTIWNTRSPESPE
jgi:hypothetical protein